MKVEAKDSNGRVLAYEIAATNESILASIFINQPSRPEIQRTIDNLSVSADAKALLNSIANTTIMIGNKIIQIGAAILEFVRDLMKAYPKATFGLVLGLLLGALIAAIPVIGFLFGAFLQPLAAAFGLLAGWMEDMRDSQLTNKIKEVSAQFSSLVPN